METTSLPVGTDRITTDATMDVVAPYDGALLGRVPRCGPAEVDRAVAAACGALAEPLPAWRRATILDRAADRLADTDVVERFARLIATEAAKPLRAARGEVTRAVATFRFAAAEARTMAGEVLPLDAHQAGEGKVGFTLRVPIGVIGAITPFNFPLNLVAHKLAPAIAAGCPVVLKPAHQTPLTGIALAELLLEDCGLPAGWVNVVTGEGAEAGQALVDHHDVAMLTFTGSPDVGWGIRARAPRKKIGLELGNNSPIILEPDGDWHTAADKIAAAGFSHAGQSCISVQRVLVHRSIVTDVEKELTAAVERLVVGDPLDEATDVSALIDRAARDRVAGWVDEAVQAGARLLCGGTVVDGVLAPTVLADVTPDMEVCRNEVFGPVVGIQAYDDFAEALQLANDTRYGLHAGVFTADIGKALAAARTLDFGGVLVNEVPTWRADQMPYGGLRDSGNTREGPAYAVREMTEIRSVVMNA